MNDKQQLLIDCISLLPVIGILVLITVANDQLVTMVAAYVLCGELLCVLVSRILNLYYIDTLLFDTIPVVEPLRGFLLKKKRFIQLPFPQSPSLHGLTPTRANTTAKA